MSQIPERVGLDVDVRDRKMASIWIGGFFVLGVLLGMLGSLVIAWRYHTDVSPGSTGAHFLALCVGFLLASQVLHRYLFKLNLRTLALLASGVAFASLVALAFLAPPAPAAFRIALLAVVGLAAGSLMRCVFEGTQAVFASSPATATNRAGALFMGGGLLATIVVGCTYFGGSLRVQTTILSLIPAAYFFILLCRRSAGARLFFNYQEPSDNSLKDLSRIVVALFSLLLFFQFACEWAIIGWLPLFLIHTLGVNPATAIWALALYFLSLIVGRLCAQLLLPIVSHRKMLLASVAAAVAGYLFLSLTTSPFIAFFSAAIVGLGHAPVFPLISEQLDERLSYRAGFYSGVISIALSGAMATPWLLGLIAEHFGMSKVMLIPFAASIFVMVLALLIMLEARLMSRHHDDDADQGLTASV